MNEAERTAYTVYVERQGEIRVWSTRYSPKGGKIALANARRAAAKYGFTRVWSDPDLDALEREREALDHGD